MIKSLFKFICNFEGDESIGNGVWAGETVGFSSGGFWQYIRNAIRTLFWIYLVLLIVYFVMHSKI
jgi:hypothetical protein